MKERTNDKFLQTHVYRDDEAFFVSTAYRQSSAMLAPDDWYYETLAWRLDNKGLRLGIVADNSGAGYSHRAIQQHFAVVEQLQVSGEFLTDDELMERQESVKNETLD